MQQNPLQFFNITDYFVEEGFVDRVINWFHSVLFSHIFLHFS
jgi:hypothetical protein